MTSRVLGLVARPALRDPRRREPLLRRVRRRVPHPEPAARPLRRGRALLGVRPHLRRRAPEPRAGGGLPARERGRRRSSSSWSACRHARSGSSSPSRRARHRPGARAERRRSRRPLTRIMMPFLLLVSLSAVAMGMLNAQSRFTAPALAPGALQRGRASRSGSGCGRPGWPPERAVVGWSIGTLLGRAPPARRAAPVACARSGTGCGRASPGPTSRDPGVAPDRPAHGRRGDRALRDAGEHRREHLLRLARGGGEHLAPERLPPHAAPARRLRRRHRDGGGRGRRAARRRAGHGAP